MKIVCVIPVQLGSKRIKDKNLLLVDGEPLVNYVATAAKAANVFSDIILYSEHEEFKKLAEINNIGFLKRQPEHGGSKCLMKNNSAECNGDRCQVHDHYLYNFAKLTKSDYIVQLHTTSPMIQGRTIKRFVNELQKYDTLISIQSNKKEHFFKNKPLNFNIKKKTPTQDLLEVDNVCWALAGWDTKKLISRFEKSVTKPNISVTFGPNTGYFNVSKIEAIDIDDKEDLYIAEACLNHRKRIYNMGKQYVDLTNLIDIERDVFKLIEADGSPILALNYNKRINNFDKLKENLKNKSGSYPVVWTDNDQVFFIQQKRNEGCRYHYHPTKDEWWVIFDGKFLYEIEGEKSFIAKSGDIVYIEKGKPHKITCKSKIGTRLACGEKDFAHIYVKNGHISNIKSEFALIVKNKTKQAIDKIIDLIKRVKNEDRF